MLIDFICFYIIIAFGSRLVLILSDVSSAIATVTALPNGHMLGYGDGGMAGMRPVYPRTQYNTQYAAQPPRVHAGDIPHSAASELKCFVFFFFS